MYKLLNSIDGITYICKLSNNAIIPPVEANTDYQAYLKWLDEGNTPEPADEGEA